MKQCPFCKKENSDNINTCSCGYVFDKEVYEHKENQINQLPENNVQLLFHLNLRIMIIGYKTF